MLAKNLKQKRSSKKLSDKAIELFRVRKRIDTQTYQLWLSPSYRIYLVFHISLLKLYQRRLENINISKYLISNLKDNDEINNIEEILKSRKRKDVLEYLVRWIDYFKKYD